MTSKHLSQAVPPVEDGEVPIVPRMYEAESAEALKQALDEAREDEVADTLGVSPAVPPDRAADGGMPFIGRVLSYSPGEAIVIERVLSLDEDLYLADHCFVHAPGVKPLSACMPVMPLTMSMEVLAEVAACLAPGLGLIGFEDVKATRWIELHDRETLPLRISAQVRETGEGDGCVRISAAIHSGQHATPELAGCVLFGATYRVDLGLRFTELGHPRRLPLSAEEIYRQRHLFHGPAFQCLAGDIVVADQGATGELLVRPTDKLFRSTARPRLLTDPALLDGVGQLIGVWAMQSERYVFPIGFRKLEFYRPTPPPGTRAPIRVEITRDGAKTLYADAEIQDGAGGVWLRIKEWGKWKFRWERRLVDFRRLPTAHLLASTVSLPELPASSVCCLVSTADVAGFDAMLLARHVLQVDEMAEFDAKATVPRRQQQWLLGRVAVKDAVRAWLAGPDGGHRMLHPAAVLIARNDSGQPLARLPEGAEGAPRVSIAHCEGRAVAMAAEAPVGVDVEVIHEHEPGFVDAFTTAAERELLASMAEEGDPERVAEWVTRMWCAKEAVGKLLGTGVDDAPKRFEVIAANVDGGIDVRLPDGERVIRARTVRDGGFIIAWAGQAARGPRDG